MKTKCCAFAVLLAVSMIFSNCKKDNQECLSDQFLLNKIEPPSNPPGYEVRLTGTGFTDNTTVRFDNSERTKTTLLNPSTLIATIPNGVLGAVEISLTDGDCIARNDRFEVYADFPSNIPFSPANIIIPQAPANFPSNFQNCWENINDDKHCILIEPGDAGDGTFSDFSEELHFGNPFLNNNKITGHFRFDKIARTSDILIEIDRRSKTGGDLEKYTGELIDPASVGSDRNFVLLLTSQKDGRQLLFEYPKF